MLNITDSLETQTTDNLTPAEILTNIIYEFHLHNSENNETVIFYATTEQANLLGQHFTAENFEFRPTDRHAGFTSKLQFWGWTESDINESIG